MAALEPLLLDRSAAEGAGSDFRSSDLADPSSIEHQIAEQNLLLAQAKEVPESVRLFVEGLADDMAEATVDATLRTDPYLLVALQKSLLAAVRALENPDPQAARRELRVRLEQMRQVYRDLADAQPIYEDRPVKELVLWLADVVDVPQAKLAELFGVSPRTFQRWIAESDDTEPLGRDARRVRVVVSVTGHLRHALTGQGVFEWFRRPHPFADGRAPQDLLDEPDALPQLTRLAASVRSALAG